MYGLEKKTKALFEFDLEKEIHKDPSKAQKLLKEAEAKAQELKNLLRQGTNSADYDNYGALLQGYTALQRVLKRMDKKS
jgi:hypothetical protein